MTDAKAWIEERRAIHTAATEGPWKARPGDEIEGPGGDNLMGGDMEYFSGFMLRGEDATAIADAHNMFPRALNALEAVNAQIDRMEADANMYGDGGHDLACDALFTYVMTLRQTIEGAINE